MTGALDERLTRLAEATPGEGSARRVRGRCHAVLARQRARCPRESTPGPRFWIPLVAGLGGVYFLESLRQALAFWGRL